MTFAARPNGIEGTGFLQVCDVTLVQCGSNRFVGRADPSRYVDYLDTPSQVLFFEALHQFAVKAARQTHGHQALLVPAQLRDLSITRVDQHAPFEIRGDVVPHGAGYRVTFTAKTADGEPLADGSIFVSMLSPESLT